MALNKETIERIEALTRDVLVDAYGGMGNLNLPVNLEIILIREGLQLRFFDADEDADLNNIEGAYDKDKRTIFVSPKSPYPRIAFTVAHELGHYFLHADLRKDIFNRLDAVQLDEEDKIEEQEANWFAASLLMPKDLVKKYWYFSEDINAIADKFYVSSSAAYWRVKNLGLI